jgi:hypothetical protein
MPQPGLIVSHEGLRQQPFQVATIVTLFAVGAVERSLVATQTRSHRWISILVRIRRTSVTFDTLVMHPAQLEVIIMRKPNRASNRTDIIHGIDAGLKASCFVTP